MPYNASIYHKNITVIYTIRIPRPNSTKTVDGNLVQRAFVSMISARFSGQSSGNESTSMAAIVHLILTLLKKSVLFTPAMMGKSH